MAELLTAKKIVSKLFKDLNGRKGFHTDDIDRETLKEWKAKWVDIIQAELKGFKND